MAATHLEIQDSAMPLGLSSKHRPLLFLCAGNTLPAVLQFRQLYDAESSTYTYILGDAGTKEAVIIDPVVGQVRYHHAIVVFL